MDGLRVLVTGASGYVAGQMLPTLRERYDLTLLDVSTETSLDRNHPDPGPVENVQIADFSDPDRNSYTHYFEGVDAVIHLGYIRQEGNPVDQYVSQRANVDMAYNVFRTAYDAGVPRIVSASSNHAANWYERDLLRSRKKEVLNPYELPLSYNFYGWSKAAYEHLGFLFACGAFGRRMGVVMVRIGSPIPINVDRQTVDIDRLKRHLGSYISPRDLTQLFVKAIETENIENEHGIPWCVVYGISNNTRAYWSLVNARTILGYRPQDDPEVKFADQIRDILGSAGPGKTGLS